MNTDLLTILNNTFILNVAITLYFTSNLNLKMSYIKSFSIIYLSTFIAYPLCYLVLIYLTTTNPFPRQLIIFTGYAIATKIVSNAKFTDFLIYFLLSLFVMVNAEIITVICSYILTGSTKSFIVPEVLESPYYYLFYDFIFIYGFYLLNKISKKITLENLSNKYKIIASILLYTLHIILMITLTLLYGFMKITTIASIILIFTSMILFFFTFKIFKDIFSLQEIVNEKKRLDILEKVISESPNYTITKEQKISQVQELIKNDILQIINLQDHSINSSCKSNADYSNNIVENLILTLYEKKFIENNISYKYSITSSFPKFVEDLEIIQIIGNIFDNVIEALGKDSENSVVYESKIIKQNYGIMCINDKAKVKRNYKAKKIIHGEGLKIIKQIVAKYNGFVDIKDDDDSFSIYIFIPLMNE